MIWETLNAHIHFLSLLWLFPVVFMFHDFEEILTVEKWTKSNGERIMDRLPLFAQNLYGTSFRMNTLYFAKDVLWVYIVIVAVTVLAVFFSFYLYLSALHVFFLHVFTHVGQSIYLRMYTPGVVTSVLLVLPYSLYAYYRLLSEQNINTQDIVWSLVLMLLLVPFGLVLLLKGRQKHIRS